MIGPAIARPTDLRIERVRLSFVCSDAALDYATFEARYTVVNPSSEVVDLAIVLHANGSEPLRITLDGAAPSAPPDRAALAAIESVYQNRRDMHLLEGLATVLTRTIPAIQAASLAVHTHARRPTFRNGGALVAIGGSFGPVRALRGRIGYEVAAPSWLLYSVTADTDFHKRAVVTPLIEAAAPTYYLLPSAGVGVGLPIQVAPDPRPGARVQGDLHVFPVGFVTSVDVYPRLGSLPILVEASVLGQVGF